MIGRALCLTVLPWAALASAAGEGPSGVKPRDLFAQHCAACHDAAGWGTRALARRVPPGREQLLTRESTPAAFTRHVVRRGIGSMPQFAPTDLSDEELARLAAWLETRD
jgi:mono/diheme cytochrome c family protein